MASQPEPGGVDGLTHVTRGAATVHRHVLRVRGLCEVAAARGTLDSQRRVGRGGRRRGDPGQQPGTPRRRGRRTCRQQADRQTQSGQSSLGRPAHPPAAATAATAAAAARTHGHRETGRHLRILY